MTYVFFVYGLAFFVLGLAILLYHKKDSAFTLARNINLVAGFGIIHGINEWLDLFIMIGRPMEVVYLDILRNITLPVSFLCLVQFGAREISSGASGWRKPFRFLTPILFVVWLTVYLLGPRDLVRWDIWSRYLLCVPGVLLTAWALFLQLSELKRDELADIRFNLKLTSITFLCYGFIAGVIVKRADFFPASVFNYDVFMEIFGFPVQILRSICAIVMAYGIVRTLKIFDWETRKVIRESRFRLDSIVNSAPVLLFMTDDKGVITFAKGKVLTTLIPGHREPIGEPVITAFAPIPKMISCNQRALGGEEFIEIIAIDGTTLQIYFSPYRDSGGKIAGTIGVAVDITLRARAQAELEKYKNEMIKNRQMILMGTMSNSMAAEVEAPLAVSRVLLLRALDELKKTIGAEDIRKRIKDSLAEISKAVNAVDGFYQAAHITPNPKAEPVDLYQTVQRIRAVFAESANRVHLDISTTGMDIIPCMHLSARELEQIFFVMIQNAIDAADPKKNSQLIMSCRINNREMELTFADTCGGIPQGKLKNVFEPFFAVDGTAKESGLGLAVVKQIVVTHKGTVTAENTPEKGAIFKITLPVKDIF